MYAAPFYVARGKNYEHRKRCVIERLRELAGIFAIDICAYAVMSNHYHHVMRVDTQKAELWPLEKVAERWEKLFSLPLLVTRYLHGETSQAEAREAESSGFLLGISFLAFLRRFSFSRQYTR